MDNIARCLDQIEKLKRVATGEDAAYVARSRIGRLILNVMRLVCNAVDIEPPSRPGPMLEPAGADEQLRYLIRICNHVNETAKTITQPSEPLDERWKSGWSALQSDLAELEECLLAMNMKSLKRG